MGRIWQVRVAQQLLGFRPRLHLVLAPPDSLAWAWEGLPYTTIITSTQALQVVEMMLAVCFISCDVLASSANPDGKDIEQSHLVAA